MYYLQSLLRPGRRRIYRPLWLAAPRAVAAVCGPRAATESVAVTAAALHIILCVPII